MQTVTVLIGDVTVGGGGVTLDDTRFVRFEARREAQLKIPGLGRDFKPTNSRGVIESLFVTASEGYIVHTEDFSHWQGEPTVYKLQSVELADLQPGGRFERLGAAAGLGRPLTLAEALGGA